MAKKIVWLGHDSFRIDAKKTIYFDPYQISSGPKADLILITHEHFDHCSPDDVAKIQDSETVIVTEKDSAKKLSGDVRVMGPGESITVDEIKIEAVPAYNITSGRDRFHPKGRDNGYILTIGGERIYIAGDTEDTPEMRALRDISIAFLPMNQPYTMVPEQVAEAAKAFRPKILYPYHFGNTDTEKLIFLLKDVPEIEVRIRDLR